MKKHEIVIDAKLVFEVETDHEVVAVSQVVNWLGERLVTGDSEILKQVGLNIGQKHE